MFTRLFGTPYEKLIGAIKAENELEARKLIAQMNITELSKVDNDGVTALTLAARQGKRVEKICELLIPKMNAQGINYIQNLRYE